MIQGTLFYTSHFVAADAAAQESIVPGKLRIYEGQSEGIFKP
jgi:hypothetical protein